MLPRICRNKSVKEVANEAGFDNLSFFGKYVRRELGVSPREYRQEKGHLIINHLAYPFTLPHEMGDTCGRTAPRFE
ncbi:AraC family transcriptional regulator [Bacteroides caecicola]|uniref:AraC family transcriptional regulator n=1 Tax=Bacteroides caecicola TaxID=1462569 RepID=A0ABS2F745_9BACE|nr:AraC family transcriptional regulator [Bacteroides caecicola]